MTKRTLGVTLLLAAAASSITYAHTESNSHEGDELFVEAFRSATTSIGNVFVRQS